MQDYRQINETSSSTAKLSGLTKVFLFVVFALVIATFAVSLVVLHRVNEHHNSQRDAQRNMQSTLQQLLLSQTTSYVVPYLTSREYQDFRGTCWDFSTIEFLEHSYRVQGIQQGYLRPNQYVKFSKQAYGAKLMNLCYHNPVCEVPGDGIAFNTTEGGETPLVFYFPELQNSILPESVCPYFSEDGNDNVCPNMTSALKNNPLKFSWTAKTYTTLYDIQSIKMALLNSQHLLTWSSSMFNTYFYQPCSGALQNDPQCLLPPSQCNVCPVGFPTACCVQTKVPMYNMDGEFYFNRYMTLEGGHAMALVGFTDEFTTRAGFTGGFIMRNTWHDGVTPLGRRGSHSVRYFTQEISDSDERSICPNSYNPRSWYQCDTVANCVGNDIQGVAKLAFQPVTLVCVDSTQCDNSTNVNYFAKNLTTVGDNLSVMCFFKAINGVDANNDLCLSPRFLDLMNTAMVPVTSQVYPNSEDECGYYIWPYEVLRKSVGQMGGFFINDFPIQWDPQSYTANSADNTGLDYSYVTKSSYVQTQATFSGPYPNFPSSV